ncbi:hemicentin-1-like [Stegostoma tigrinum]|uniref:hemicentin-1-like n=1 Tax=Stegostoma tigrinum TaxID=3053191 RepID=UPI00286FD768|nr:hemicentin-1-like [Stegostoma tigrinum]
MIRKSYFLLLLLQAGLAQEWQVHTPREVTAQEGTCAHIPCRYSYPSNLASQPRTGIWLNNEDWETSKTAFHSQDHSRELGRFYLRTQLSGNLKNGDCSLIINRITQEDAGPYYFRVEFDNVNSYSYYPVTQLHVSDFTDKPTIVPVEIIAGKRVSLRCTFNTTCTGTAPALTWDTPTAVHGSVSNTATQHGATLTYTSVLALTPSLRDQGQTLTCRVSYPTVSSEQTLVLTVQYAPRNLSISSLAVVKDSSINIIEGNSAVIICSVESFPASNLIWRHLNATMNRTSSDNELWLQIPHVTYRETGDYQCVAENERGAVKGSITINVEYAPRNLSISSLAVVKDSSINIIEGNSAVIICSVESFPASNLIWRHLNATMNRTSSDNELWLQIPHVTYRETGDYQCVAENEHGAVKGSITTNVECECTQTSTLRGGMVAQWLELQPHTTSDPDLIPHLAAICVKFARLPRVRMDAPRNLTISSLAAIKDSSIHIIEGNSALIICSIESFPASNLIWRHLNDTLNGTSSDNELWLQIPHVTYRETGDYQCVAENEHGAVKGSITINVEFAPRNLSISSHAAIKDSSINIIEGNSAVIICSIESFPASNLIWRHLNATMNRTSSDNELWLQIRHVTYRETGDYQCVAENEHGAVKASITINVESIGLFREHEFQGLHHSVLPTDKDAPRNLSISSLAANKDSLINIIEGNSAVIICSVESFPASNLIWRHLNATMNRTSSDNELWLQIPHFTYRETGDYQCVAENEYGAVKGSITINVEYSPRNLSISSLAVIKDSSINIFEGNPAEIICSVESFPASHLIWRHLNDTLNRTSSNNELWLQIPHITYRENGDYQCVAENEHGALESSITINVECIGVSSHLPRCASSVDWLWQVFPKCPGMSLHIALYSSGRISSSSWTMWPMNSFFLHKCCLIHQEFQDAPRNLSITSRAVIQDLSINIIEGNSAVITCSVESFPASNLTWRYLNVVMNRTSFNNELWLEIPHATYRETGEYQCVAENEHGAVEGSITIMVEHPPRNLAITYLTVIEDSSINITEGNSPMIMCSVESFPASKLTWRHLNVTMNRTSSNNELWLEIPHITSKDTGDYQCVAENEHGSMESSIIITVQYPPWETTVSTSGASGGIREGNNVTLTCSSESVPSISHYTWFRIEGNASTQLNTNSQILSFTPVTRGDDAGFYCTATNPLGNSSSNTTHLNVEYDPEISWESECTRRSEGITCVCVANSNPPGDLTWHLPHANLSGNQTWGGFVSLQLRAGHQVMGFLILTGHQDEQEVMGSCLVRNPYGAATFNVQLRVKGRDSNKWTVGLVITAIVFSIFLAVIVILLSVNKRKRAIEQTASKTSDIALTSSQLSVKHQGSQNMEVIDPQNTTRDITREEDTPAPQDDFESSVEKETLETGTPGELKTSSTPASISQSCPAEAALSTGARTQNTQRSDSSQSEKVREGSE